MRYDNNFLALNALEDVCDICVHWDNKKTNYPCKYCIHSNTNLHRINDLHAFLKTL